MRDGRLRRFLSGLGLGYVQTAASVLVGLWMTPYLLGHLGSHDYGLWLLGSQVLTYLALFDIGIIALVPRDVAAAVGRGGDDRSALPSLIGETARLVLWQVPAVAIVGALAVWLMPAEWATLRWPLALVVLTFVITFPLRLCGAVLQGVQDLTFLGVVQIASWAAGAFVTVAGAWSGWGLHALAWGWSTTQVISALVSWRRLQKAHHAIVPLRLPSLTFEAARRQLSRGAWISFNQIAQVLLVGTDLVVIGKLLGPSAVVAYACTGRLAAMLANQPQMFMQMALPALSELRTAASRERLVDVATSMAQVMLLFSGAIVTVVLIVNAPFVAWWVGESRFAGLGLTAIFLGGMLVRHLNVTAVYTLFCFGNERRIAVTSIADGVVSLVAMLILVPKFGWYGAALGPLAGTCLVSLPANFLALGRDIGASPLTFITPLKPWFVRFASMLVAIGALAALWPVRGLWAFAALALAVAIAYVLVMLPVLNTPPLGPMVSGRFQPWIARFPSLAKYFAKPVDALAP
jgi:O-antigen/teichoic acid export membrane protein